ncbi:uncharacterized protein LOC131332754 [Rhododendron vialii]|uniref:uncharacterized protein LOC131332754 n=1 Tax=Rhododendron vialii TaxID=182163 RepID=UPI00265DE301|nr:uncharacterized protein LOC131332754 [Rhododendron vialii]
MTEQVASTLMFCETAREVWTQAKELYSGVDNLCRTYDLHQSFFNISQGDDSFEDYYATFRRICNELDICEPLSADIQVIRCQRECMRVTRFLYGASSTFKPMGNQILWDRDLPPLSEVFSRLRQLSSISGTPAPDRSALTSAVSDSSVFSVSRGLGRSRDSGFRGCGRNFGMNGRGSGGRKDTVIGGRDDRTFSSGGRMTEGGRGRGRGAQLCTYCGVTNHWVDTCYELYGFPQAHQAIVFEDTRQFAQSSADSVVVSADEYQRLLSFQIATGSSIAMLSQIGPSIACPVGRSSHVTLADGSTTTVTGFGSVPVTSFPTLSSVLHDLQTGKKISGGTEQGGLYYLTDPQPAALQTLESPYRQHCHLGHPAL